MGNSLARKERLGILAIVIVALLLTALLLFLKSPLFRENASPEETAIAMDSIPGTDSEDSEMNVIYKEKNKKEKKKRSRRSKSKKGKRGKDKNSTKKSTTTEFRDMEEDCLSGEGG